MDDLASSIQQQRDADGVQAEADRNALRERTWQGWIQALTTDQRQMLDAECAAVLLDTCLQWSYTDRRYRAALVEGHADRWQLFFERGTYGFITYRKPVPADALWTAILRMMGDSSITLMTARDREAKS